MKTTKKIRNKVKNAVRKDKASYQLQLANSFKGNPKRFHGHFRSMQTVKGKHFLASQLE